MNLGSGSDYIPGWVNVDIDTTWRVDVVADLRKPFPFNDNSIDEIKASDILEHFTKEDGVIFLNECYRVLKVGGKLFLRTHNIHQIINQFGNDPEVMIHFIYGNTKNGGLFGAHKYAYTKDSLRRILIKAGFQISSVEKETTNFTVNAVKQNKIINRKMHIAVIQQTPDIGGAETYMHSLIEKFLKKKNTVTLATNLDKYIAMYRNYPVRINKIPVILDFIGSIKGLVKSVFFLPVASIFYWGLLLSYKKDGVDVILMSGFSEKILVSFFSLLFKIPVVWIEFGPLESIFRRNFHAPRVLYKLLCSIPKSVIVPTENTKRDLMQYGKVSLSKLLIIPCGVEIKKESHKKRSVIREWKNNFIIGNVSRLTREKGQEFIIQAAPIMLKRCPKVRFLLVGDGPDKKYFEDLTKTVGVQDKFKITGYVNDTSDYYRFFDIFIFPTLWQLEGFGLVVTEAMSYGIPVVASDFGPVPEIIEDGKSGILFRAGDKKDLARKVTALILDSEKRDRIARQGWVRTKKLYDINLSSKKILEVLEDSTL